MPNAPKNSSKNSSPPGQIASVGGDHAPVTLADVTAAAATIQGSVIVTECNQSRTLSEMCGCNIWLKFENLQFTSTFKERGALNRLHALSPEERRRGVIAMSAGNHAQGVAYHARRLGIPAVHRDADRHADGEGREHQAARRRGHHFRRRPWRRRASSRATTARPTA